MTGIKVGSRVQYGQFPDSAVSGKVGTVVSINAAGFYAEVAFDGYKTSRVIGTYNADLSRLCVIPEAMDAVPHGGKDDSGKSNPGLLFQGCPNALKAVCVVLDGGAKKYSADSWQQVPDGIKRYRAAFERHKQEVDLHGLWAVNPDFGLLHIDHMITDLLFIRELMHKEANATV